jgi:hypothetical protein
LDGRQLVGSTQVQLVLPVGHDWETFVASAQTSAF